MFIVDGEAVGSGVPPRGTPLPAEGGDGIIVVVSPAVARSIKAAEQQQEAEMSASGSVSATVSAQVTAEPELEEPEPNSESEPERPKDYASKEEWINWSVGKGADRDEAESLTKVELIDLYGKES